MKVASRCSRTSPMSWASPSRGTLVLVTLLAAPAADCAQSRAAIAAPAPASISLRSSIDGSSVLEGIACSIDSESLARIRGGEPAFRFTGALLKGRLHGADGHGVVSIPLEATASFACVARGHGWKVIDVAPGATVKVFLPRGGDVDVNAPTLRGQEVWCHPTWMPDDAAVSLGFVDERGRLRVRGVEIGLYRFGATRSRVAEQMSPVRIVTSAASLLVDLPPTRSTPVLLSGKIHVDDELLPAALHSMVELREPSLTFAGLDDNGLPTATDARLTTSSDGSVQYEVKLPSPGGYSWSLQPGRHSGLLRVETGRETEDIEVRYGGSLRVLVASEAAAEGLEGADVEWRTSPPTDGYGVIVEVRGWAPARTREAHTFVAAVPVGAVEIRVHAPGHVRARRTVLVEGGTSPRVSVRLEQTAGLEVRLKNGDQTVSASVMLTADYGDEHYNEAADGVAKFSDLPPAPYEVAVKTASGKYWTPVRSVVLRSGRQEVVTIDLAK